MEYCCKFVELFNLSYLHLRSWSVYNLWERPSRERNLCFYMWRWPEQGQCGSSAPFKVFGVCRLFRGQRWDRLFVGGVILPLFFFFFLTPFPCYLNFQTSALMSIVGTSRGLLAHRQVLVLVSRRESRIPLGRGVGYTHSLLAFSLEQHQAAFSAVGAGVQGWPLLRPWACWGCAPRVCGLSPHLFKACPKGSVFLQSCWEEVV